METDAGLVPRSASAYGLNLDYFEKVARSNGWTNDGGFDFERIAAEVVMSVEQVRRVVGRRSRPGVTFMAGLQAADHDFRVRLMFPLVKADEPIGKD